VQAFRAAALGVIFVVYVASGFLSAVALAKAVSRTYIYAQAPAQTPQTTFRSSVDVTSLDVTVVDNAGKPIASTWLPGTTAAPPPVHNGTAYWIKVTADRDGTFTVTNARNSFSKKYRPGV